MRSLRLALLLAAIAVIASSCALNPLRRLAPGPSIDLDAIAARKESFNTYYEQRVQRAVNEILRAEPDRQAQRNARRWRSLAGPQMRPYIFAPDSFRGLLDAWAYALRLEAYLEDGEGSELFGAGQESARAAARDIAAQIRAIAQDQFATQYFEQVDAAIREAAAERPMRGFFEVPPAVADADATTAVGAARDAVTRVASLPFAPLMTFTRVNETGESIADFARTASRMADIAEDAPREVRWQLENLILDLEDNAQFNDAIAAVRETAAAVDRASALGESLPAIAAQLRREADAASDRVDAILAGVQESLDGVQASLAAASQTTRDAGELFEPIQGLLASVESTSGEIRLLLADVEKLQERQAASAPPPGEEGPGLAEVAEMVANAQSTVVELRGLLLDVQSLQPPTAALTEVESTSQRVLVDSKETAQALVDHAFRRLAALAIILAAGGLLIVAAARWPRRKAA